MVDDPFVDPSQDEEEAKALASDQLYDFVTNEPVKDNPKERTLQAVARSLVYEYGFDHTQLERDVTVTYEVTDPHGRTRRTRRKVDLVVYPEAKPKELQHVIRVAVIQPPKTKSQDRKKGIDLLEDVMGALSACEYGLWTNGTDLEFRQKVMTAQHIQPEYVELCDLPGEGETAAALDDPRRQVMRIATSLATDCWARREFFSSPRVILGTVLSVALMLRVSLIAADRFHPDEALYSYWGLLIASGRDVLLQSVIVDKPPVFLYTLAAFFALFGPTETAARMPNLVASLASIVMVYWLAATLYDRRVGMLSALLMAFSPLHILFSPTAFTDPLMVCFALAACLLAAKARFWSAGLLLGLAAMTRPTALIFLPLVLFLAGMAWHRERRIGIIRPVAAFGFGFLLVIVGWLVWDGVLRVDAINIMSAGAQRYPLVRVAPAHRILPRLHAWLASLQYLTGSSVLDIVLTAGLPFLLGYDFWKRHERPGWLFDWALAIFALLFVAFHTFVPFRLITRYLLGLVPVAAILLSRVMLLPYDIFFRRRASTWPRMLFVSLLVVLLAVVLVRPTRTALRRGYPVGSDHGAYQGIDDVADYLKGNVPPGSILLERWLAWHFYFYLFGQPLELHHYQSDEDALETARRYPNRDKYIVFPSWKSADELEAYLLGHGWKLCEVYRTFRPNGRISFTIFVIEPAVTSSVDWPAPTNTACWNGIEPAKQDSW